MNNLENKIALVTGAAGGIGASIAKDLAAAGATVILNYATSKSAAEKTVAEIVAAGGKATAIQGDVSKPEEISQTFAAIGSEGGSVINIGSVASSMSPPYGSIYSATKGAVDSITISLSKELGPRQIRVNSLNPGLVETEGTQAVGALEGEFHDSRLRTTPLGRIGQPDWVNGQAILAAGGHTI